MKQLKVTTTATATVTLDGLDINNVIKQAADLAHEVLEKLSKPQKKCVKLFLQKVYNKA